MSTKPLRAVGSVTAATGAVTLVLADSALTRAWDGHGERVIELLDADEDFVAAPLTIGRGKGLVLSLEGVSGEVEVYMLPDGAVALVEPTLAWWLGEYPTRTREIEALFTAGLDARASTVVGKVEVPSGRLALFDSNADPKRLGRDDDSTVVPVPRGKLTVRRQVLRRPWAKRVALVVAHLWPAAHVRSKEPVTVALPRAKKAKAAPAAPRAKARSTVVFTVSPTLAKVVGSGKTLTLREVTDKLDAYIERHGLRDPKSPLWIRADAKLAAVYGKTHLSKFEAPPLVRKHLKRA